MCHFNRDSRYMTHFKEVVCNNQTQVMLVMSKVCYLQIKRMTLGKKQTFFKQNTDQRTKVISYEVYVLFNSIISSLESLVRRQAYLLATVFPSFFSMHIFALFFKLLSLTILLKYASHTNRCLHILTCGRYKICTRKYESSTPAHR